MRLIVAFLAGLMLACIVKADEFDDRLAKFSAETARRKAEKAICRCGGDPSLCSCYVCQCAGGGDCRTAKKKVEVKPKKAPLYFKHHCGCPSMSCNCAPLGGCHCSENAAFNRINPTWQASPSGGYSLWRGGEQLGYYDGKTYWPLNADGEWCEPTKVPIPLPRQQSMAIPPQAVQACRS